MRLVAAIVVSVLMVAAASEARSRWIDQPSAVAAAPSSTTTTTTTPPAPAPTAVTTSTLPGPHGDLAPANGIGGSADAFRRYVDAVIDRRYVDAYAWVCDATKTKVSEADFAARLERVPPEARVKAYQVITAVYHPYEEYAGAPTAFVIYGRERYGGNVAFNFSLVGSDPDLPMSWRICTVLGGDREVLARMWPCASNEACDAPDAPSGDRPSPDQSMPKPNDPSLSRTTSSGSRPSST